MCEGGGGGKGRHDKLSSLSLNVQLCKIYTVCHWLTILSPTTLALTFAFTRSLSRRTACNMRPGSHSERTRSRGTPALAHSLHRAATVDEHEAGTVRDALAVFRAVFCIALLSCVVAHSLSAAAIFLCLMRTLSACDPANNSAGSAKGCPPCCSPSARQRMHVPKSYGVSAHQSSR